MTIVADCQLALPIEDTTGGVMGWKGLPEPARGAVLVLLARLIARDVLITNTTPGEEGSGG
ncbi:MAG TPA: hypothetical protein VJ757_14360 [Pseudonocardiaceae bacterium]|nr:hypothetical protein [Pseudonocardiaceae bacterium]